MRDSSAKVQAILLGNLRLGDQPIPRLVTVAPIFLSLFLSFSFSCATSDVVAPLNDANPAEPTQNLNRYGMPHTHRDRESARPALHVSSFRQRVCASVVEIGN